MEEEPPCEAAVHLRYESICDGLPQCFSEGEEGPDVSFLKELEEDPEH